MLVGPQQLPFTFSMFIHGICAIMSPGKAKNSQQGISNQCGLFLKFALCQEQHTIFGASEVSSRSFLVNGNTWMALLDYPLHCLLSPTPSNRWVYLNWPSKRTHTGLQFQVLKISNFSQKWLSGFFSNIYPRNLEI